MSTKEEIKQLPKDEKAIRCIDIGDLELAAVGEHLTQLDFLYVNTKAKITDRGLMALGGLRYLKKVVLMDCSLITDDGLKVFEEMPRLAKLVLDRGPLVTDRGLGRLISNKTLRMIDLSRFSQVTKEGVERLQQLRPDCKIILRDE